MVNQMQKELRQKRQKNVLNMIVKFHISTAEPVGSHLISGRIGLSSATIRSIMYELEEMGFIWQPHTSAGRVPTYKGYRMYVNSLMEDKEFLEWKPASLNEGLSSARFDSIEDIIIKGLQLCSRMTSQTCIALFPTLKLKRYLTEKLKEKAEDILTFLYDFEDRLYYDGAHYLAEQPEFKDVESICSVLKVLEDKRDLLYILEEDSKAGGIKVHIGSENSMSQFDRCSLITANYNFEDRINGSLGIIGPMRMEYDRVIPAVNFIAGSISGLFEEMI